MESISRKNRVSFRELKTRLIEVVNARILNGEFTERGLARILEISQPQMHNVLKGARKLNVDLADRLLVRLDLNVADLFRDEEFEEQYRLREQSARMHEGLDFGWHLEIRSPLKKPPTPELRRPTHTERSRISGTARGNVG